MTTLPATSRSVLFLPAALILCSFVTTTWADSAAQVDFEELSGSVGQPFISAENHGSASSSLEYEGQVADEHVPRIVVGKDEEGAALQFQGVATAVGLLRDIEWKPNGFSLSMDFSSAEGQEQWTHLFQMMDSDNNKVASAAFVRENEAAEEKNAGVLVVDGPGPHSRVWGEVPILDGQWRTLVLEYHARGGDFEHGFITVYLDQTTIGSYHLREPAPALSTVTLAIGGQHHGYRPFQGAVDNIRLEFFE